MLLELLSPLAQALATLAGAIFVLVGIWYRDRLETRSKAKNAKVQILAEIRALLDLIELNEYLPVLRDTIAELKSTGTCRQYFGFQSSRSFSAVYEANLQNLGLLGSAAGEVVRFYMIITSAVEDKDTIAAMAAQIKQLEDQRQAVDPALRTRILRFHEMIFGKLSTAVHIGEELMEKMRLEDPEAGKRRKRNRAATIAELDDIEKTPETGLVGKYRAHAARAHERIQQ